MTDEKRRPVEKSAVMMGVSNKPRMEEFAFGNEQRSNPAVIKDAPTMPSEEVTVGDMEQKKQPRSANMKGALTLPKQEDYVGIMDGS